MRILVTNDDGIDSPGLHILAKAMKSHGDVTVVAPDREFSGSGASLGAIHSSRPEVKKTKVAGIEQSWAVSGPPALCVLYCRLGVFGDPFDLVVSGINPGCNVGHSIYHSGTVGAVLTARVGNIHGVAVSQAAPGWDLESQGDEKGFDGQCWDSAAEITSIVVSELLSDLNQKVVAINLNVPNLPVELMQGWKETSLGTDPLRRLSGATLEPKPEDEGSYQVDINWGEVGPLDPATDGGAVMQGWVSATWLGHLTDISSPQKNTVSKALDHCFNQ